MKLPGDYFAALRCSIQPPNPIERERKSNGQTMRKMAGIGRESDAREITQFSKIKFKVSTEVQK